MKSSAAYWALFGNEFPLYQIYLYKKGLRTTHGTTQVYENSCCGSSFGKIIEWFSKLMCAAALA
jgi:hypothetical protein